PDGARFFPFLFRSQRKGGSITSICASLMPQSPTLSHRPTAVTNFGSCRRLLHAPPPLAGPRHDEEKDGRLDRPRGRRRQSGKPGSAIPKKPDRGGRRI